MQILQNFNEALFQLLNSLALRSQLFDTLVFFSAEYLLYWMIAGLVLIVLILIYVEEVKVDVTPEVERKWMAFGRHALIALASGVVAWGVAQIIKNQYVSPRPFLALSDVNLIFEHGDVDSFPSGHATATFAMATALYFHHKKLGMLYFAAATATALARVIAGVHWPLDVLAGATLGVIVVLLLRRIFKR